MSQPTSKDCDIPFLERHIAELRQVLQRVVDTARFTSAAANCCLVHRQLLGEARQILDEADNDRTARFMELEALEEQDNG